MSVISFDFYSHEPTVSEYAPDPSTVRIGTIAYHQGKWARVVYRITPKNRFALGVKEWELIPEHQVPQELRLKALLLK